MKGWKDNWVYFTLIGVAIFVLFILCVSLARKKADIKFVKEQDSIAISIISSHLDTMSWKLDQINGKLK